MGRAAQAHTPYNLYGSFGVVNFYESMIAVHSLGILTTGGPKASGFEGPHSVERLPV